jgi:fanconi anemia group J protein
MCRYANLTILDPLGDMSQQSPLVEETSADVPVGSPSYYSVNTSEVISTGGEQIVDTSFLHSISNRNLSCPSTSATPEKTANKSCHLKNESLINRSVNSHCQKKRRLSSPMSCCTYTDHSNSPCNPFCCSNGAIGIVSGDLKMNVESMKMSKCETVKFERNHKQEKASAKKSMQKRLFISCIRCKTAVGLKQNGFLVTCSQSSSSKFYVAHLLKHGLSTVHFPEDGSLASQPVEVEVMDCDASSLNLNIVRKLSSQGSAQHCDVWSAKDGCVYRAVTCPFCSSENVCSTILGVQVVATDVPNQPLADKVLCIAACKL